MKTDPIFVTKQQAADLLSACTKTVDNLEKKGFLTPVRIDRFVRYDVDEIRSLKVGRASK